MRNNSKKEEWLKCEACGEFHPDHETETIIIKLIKGKDCELKRNKIFEPLNIQPTFIPGPTEINTGDKPQAPKRSIVPPPFLSVMTPPGGQGEAIERRNV